MLHNGADDAIDSPYRRLHRAARILNVLNVAHKKNERCAFGTTLVAKHSSEFAS